MTHTPGPAQKSHPRPGAHALKGTFETFNVLKGTFETFNVLKGTFETFSVLKGTFRACPPRAEAA